MCVCYLEHELVFGDPLDGLQQVCIKRQFVIQFLLAFLEGGGGGGLMLSPPLKK